MSGSEGKVPVITPGAIVGLVVALVLTIGSGMVGCPVYAVWRAQKAGEAELAQADQDDGKDSCGILIQEPLTRMLGLADGRRRTDRTAAARAVC